MYTLRILIKNIDEIHSSGTKVRQEQFILIEDNKIKRIDKMTKIDEISDYDRIIDADGMIALPGFINTHTHAAMTLMRAYADDMPLDQWLQNKIWPFESKIKPDDIYWGTALAVVEMIKTGTTTFSDMYFAVDKIAEIVDQSGMRAVLS
jgi:5-methylthioadenosine/S-adenosylhomocysteine deaminase